MQRDAVAGMQCRSCTVSDRKSPVKAELSKQSSLPNSAASRPLQATPAATPSTAGPTRALCRPSGTRVRHVRGTGAACAALHEQAAPGHANRPGDRVWWRHAGAWPTRGLTAKTTAAHSSSECPMLRLLSGCRPERLGQACRVPQHPGHPAHRPRLRRQRAARCPCCTGGRVKTPQPACRDHARSGTRAGGQAEGRAGGQEGGGQRSGKDAAGRGMG